MTQTQQSLAETKPSKLQYMLAGFTQVAGFRVFAFERMGEDRIRTKCAVRANLEQARRYGIQVQDLPLLCRSLLEQHENGVQTPLLTYGEEEMSRYAKNCTENREAAALKKKAFRKPVAAVAETPWRAPH
ncbi:hypothetical protein [Bryobacter aggregatus]|uniref:hypothetical protein n=1 Tax=Bryobacter aggregatus TaxID=360054 RepID=UPI0004E15FF9|nr:hypothetical protein [Bryobacter aggregatus]